MILAKLDDFDRVIVKTEGIGKKYYYLFEDEKTGELNPNLPDATLEAFDAPANVVDRIRSKFPNVDFTKFYADVDDKDRLTV